MGSKVLALLLIDVQKGFSDSAYWGKRNNPEFEKNITDLLMKARELNFTIIHIQHLSKEEKSPLRPGQAGVEFMPGIEPRFGERVFQKTVNSAFVGTNLESYLQSQNISCLVMAGLTSDHCVSTSARMASNLGFQVYVVADCTATFERKGSDTTYPADLVHCVSLASLNSEFATVVDTVEEFKKREIDLLRHRENHTKARL